MGVPHVKRRVSLSARNRRRVVTVIGSGQTADPRSQEVGRLIASLGFDLLTGGGRGAMEAVSRAFFETSPRRGVVIGVMPGTVEPLESVEAREPIVAEYVLPPGYPNDWVEVAIYTHLPARGPEGTLRSSRNHINVLSADAIVALPGGEGTAAEMLLAQQYGVPTVAYGEHGSAAPEGIVHTRSLGDLRAFLIEHAAR